MRLSAGLLLVVVACRGGTVRAQHEVQAPEQMVLVELFTSEGCSSCPPADALLKRLNGMHVGDQLVVGISEHVTYWNRLGWTDPYSQEMFTQRQEEYAREFHLEGPYTPQMVVNGQREMVGSDATAVERAIRAERQAANVALRIDGVEASGKMLQVSFEASGKGLRQGATVYAVIAEDVAPSKVGRGENSGRTLGHVAVARTFQQLMRTKSGVRRTVPIPLPEMRAGSSGRRLIVFAQRPTGEVLAVQSRPF